MEINSACSLAGYINERGSRFHANVLDFGSQGWVIVSDRETDKYLEPIADPQDYLRRSQAGMLRIDAAYHDLIDAWIKQQLRPQGETLQQ
jgi:hypothetical protein